MAAEPRTPRWGGPRIGIASPLGIAEQSIVLSPEQAAFVRRLRVEEGKGDRVVASACYEAWKDMGDPELMAAWRTNPRDKAVAFLLYLAAAECLGERVEPYLVPPRGDAP